MGEIQDKIHKNGTNNIREPALCRASNVLDPLEGSVNHVEMLVLFFLSLLRLFVMPVYNL